MWQFAQKQYEFSSNYVFIHPFQSRTAVGARGTLVTLVCWVKSIWIGNKLGWREDTRTAEKIQYFNDIHTRTYRKKDIQNVGWPHLFGISSVVVSFNITKYSSPLGWVVNRYITPCVHTSHLLFSMVFYVKYLTINANSSLLAWDGHYPLRVAIVLQ